MQQEPVAGTFEKLTKILSKIPRDAPACREAFEKESESDPYTRSQCYHCWRENGNCLCHANEMCPLFIAFIKHLVMLPKSRSFMDMFMLKHVMTKADTMTKLLQEEMKNKVLIRQLEEWGLNYMFLVTRSQENLKKAFWYFYVNINSTLAPKTPL